METGILRLEVIVMKVSDFREWLKNIVTWPRSKKQARQCGTDKNTSFHWCHRFLTLPAATKASRLQEIVNADETSFPLSCKGQRHLDRPPRKRGKQIYTRGTGKDKDQLPVLVARDRSAATADFMLNVLDKKTIESPLWAVLVKDAIFCSNAAAYRSVAYSFGISANSAW